MIRELAVCLGPDSSLVAIVSEPPPEKASADKPAVILLNAGLIHRVGPARLYVRLARALARSGFVAMRLDLPGRGDSEVRRGAQSVALAALADVQSAMDFLAQSKGARKFILVGICSGAGNAVEAAEHDPRVAGAVLINTLAYPTFRWRVLYYFRRLGRASSWWNTLTGRNSVGRKLRRLVHPQKRGDNEMLGAIEATSGPPRDAAADLLKRILARGVRLFFVYSGGPGYNYRGQFADAFPDVSADRRVRVEYIPEADHTFTRLASQDRLESEILSWTAQVPQSGDDPPASAPPPSSGGATGARGSSGRDRLLGSVIWGWLGHLVFIAAGFVMPRLIDDRLGQASLGLWDFCWSLVSYFNLAQLGVGASVNRHVAAHRTLGDVRALNRTVSSVVAVQIAASLLVIALTVGSVVIIPSLFGGRLDGAVGDAQWVVGMLGMSLAVQLALHVFRGVLTGCHRWDLHNQIEAGFHAVSVFAMVAAVLLGAQLVVLAGIILIGQTIAEVTRAVVTFRVCPELRIRPQYVELPEALQMLTFGGKLTLVTLGQVALVQTNNLIVLQSLGVAALALYARPVALIRNVSILSQKLSLTLVPTVSSLQSSGSDDELRDLLQQTTRYGAFVILPALTTLAILGGPILHIWMGPAYRQEGLMLILALGSVLPLTQQTAATALIGLNRHGVLALISLVSAAIGIAASAVSVRWFGLSAAAASIALAGTLGGIAVPVAACRAVQIPITKYLRVSYTQPVLAMIPFALVLIIARVVWTDQPVRAVLGGLALGGLAVAPLYWRWAVPARLKLRAGTLTVNVTKSLRRSQRRFTGF